MKNPKFVVALFKRDELNIAYQCDSRDEVDALVGNTLSDLDNYTFYDDDVIANFKKDDEEYDYSFYKGKGWYNADSRELEWVDGEYERISIDIYRIDVFEFKEFRDSCPDKYLEYVDYHTSRFNV